MTKGTIKKYGISFQNKINGDGTINKFPCATKAANITALLYEWTSVSEINNGLLKDIEEAIANSDSEVKSGSTSVELTINQNFVDFYPRWGGEVYSMPTADLREIVIGWRDFLLKKPLNKTSIFSLNICHWLTTKLKNGV